MVPNHAVQFAFTDEHDAAMAYATLHELGYSPVRQGSAVHIHLDRGDLTSALEIAMAHGGQYIAEAPLRDESVIHEAYSMGAVDIPAHTVNEDFSEVYMEAAGELGDEQASYAAVKQSSEEDSLFDPDDRSYGFFSGDVRG